MSALHETTQKRICRSAFAVLCGIPALWTCLWIAWRILPWHHQLWERQLAAELELDVRLMQISEPRPGRFRCAAALLASRGSQPCIELRNVEAAWRDNKLVVAAQDAVIYVDRVMDDRADLAKRLRRIDLPWELKTGDVQFVLASQGPLASGGDDPTMPMSDERRSDDTSQRFAMLAARWSPGDAQSEGLSSHLLVRTFNQAVVDSTATDWMLNWNVASSELMHDRVRLEAKRTPIPLKLLEASARGMDAPGMAALADGAFLGRVRWEGNGQHVAGDAVGVIDRCDAQRLLGADSVHRLQGQTHIELAAYAWEGIRLVSAEGSLRIENGVMSRSLWQAGVDRLCCGLPPGPLPAEGEGEMPFDRVECRFQFDRNGLNVWGGCGVGSDVSGVLAVREGRALLLEPRFSQLPSGAWVQFLYPTLFPAGAAPVWAPMTREVIEAASRLPLPPNPPIQR